MLFRGFQHSKPRGSGIPGRPDQPSDGLAVSMERGTEPMRLVLFHSATFLEKFDRALLAGRLKGLNFVAARIVKKLGEM